ncbi:PilZ domain-containing protein [Thalassotalea fusca]
MSNDDQEFEERRQHFRLDMEKELIDINWVDDNGAAQQKKIVCVDFSRGGLKLDCDTSIPLDTVVTIVFRSAHPNSQQISGKVIRCIKQENGWFDIALQIDE